MIKLTGINKSFNKNKVLNDIEIQIRENDFFLIKGPSGAGKSTLLNIIGMLELADTGDVCIANIKNPKINKKSGRNLLKNKISYLFQNYGLIDNKSIEYNLLIALKFKKIKKKEKIILIKKALNTVNLDKNIKTKIYNLSGGEQQRVAIAKLFLKDSDIILCDEPTGSLDEENRNAVLKLLTKLNKEGKTIIIVSHDPIMTNYINAYYDLEKNKTYRKSTKEK